MSRVITFSRVFPSYHPKVGEPTYFVEKIWKGLYPEDPDDALFNHECAGIWSVYKEIYESLSAKYHTIRAGNRFKVGDWFSPRVWSGKPYNSKQIIIAPDIQVKKVWDFEMKIGLLTDETNFFLDDHKLFFTLNRIANNDGLSKEDFYGWFNKPFKGQMICWNENIEY